MRFELREFDGASFGERHEIEYGATLADFDDYVDQFAIAGVEDEPARPWDGIIAGRQFEDPTGRQFSCFCYEEG